MRLLVLLPLVLVLAACSGGSDDDALSPAPEPIGRLVVEQDQGDGSPPQRWTLVCEQGGAASGDHPEAAAACAHLLDADEPFAPLPEDRICTQVYGGPQTAHVTGTWRGEEVDLRLSREDGCAIAQWDGLGPLLPGPVGVEPGADLPQ
ncbi:MAG: SSI family serine proteinase inhibitor [Actinomycetes bacterium]